jgi:hypothetical protein
MNKTLHCEGQSNFSFVWDIKKPSHQNPQPVKINVSFYYENTTNIGEKSLSSLTLVNVAVQHAGTYRCINVKTDKALKEFKVAVLGNITICIELCKLFSQK